MPNFCPYCSVSKEDTWVASELAVAVMHPQPLMKFHFVIAPTRHVAAFYDLDVQEQGAIWVIIGEIEKRLASTMKLAGVDIGFEDGVTERDHAHVHLVPRTAERTITLPQGVEWVFSAA